MKRLKMAIMGTGKIASDMAETISRMEEVECFAVGSRSLEKAEAFAKKYGFQKAFGSYEDLVKEKEVELVYIATPHSEHFANAMLCIRHKKPVLCEKAFTANAKQARELLDRAEEENVFITEAMWVRYLPMLETIRQELENGAIGSPTMLTANLGYQMSGVPRLQNPELAGGTLLDVGVYPINFARMLFGDKIIKITSACTYTDSGVDEQDCITFLYEDGRAAQLAASMLSVSDRRGTVYGTKGFMVIENISNFESLTVYDMNYREVKKIGRPAQITGYEYEVRACIRALTEGKLECEEMPHEETLRVMELMDGLREEWGVKFPFE
ncbi:MAG TPA: Gfo/Idh/MocA family oxidoreductase [Candidatus Eisenbergiella merdipullorum]|uniref:Gfo/Idh/MocA family oxidoreductase n=1 Tax=Candidatus Eisenbergiella merdipullorum TaxID=2838553 RepID=A0A9D2I382_9FIRM|nr:Gfo/Idh/MocA family oxidoreductase [Candidatus Eisenbergiella merdipullorum]